MNLTMNTYKKSNQNVLVDTTVQIGRLLELDRTQRGSLVNQIVEQIAQLVHQGHLPPLARMPSVRVLAASLSISAFSAVEAYDRLVALGHLVSRRGSGYFVAPRHAFRDGTGKPVASDDAPNVSALLGTELFHTRAEQQLLPAAQPWLPEDWTSPKWLQECTRAALRCPRMLTQGFSHPLGLPELRQFLATHLQQTGFSLTSDDVLLTRSAVHALDLTLRALLAAGDAVLIETPCFPALRPLLSQQGCRILEVPRTADGLDLSHLAERAATHKPKLAIITTCLHNPLGCNLSSEQAHQLLALAEQFDFQIIEDDVFRPLAEPFAPSLALMDGLKRVIRIDSSSKILPSLVRVGSVVAAPELLGKIARVKLATGLGCPDFCEKTLLHLLLSPEFRRHISRIKTRFEIGRESLLERLYQLELSPLAVPDGGPFICVRLAGARTGGLDIARFALEQGVSISPSLRFSAEGAEDAPWFRLNVAYAEHPKLHALLEALARQMASTTSPI